MVEHQEHRSLFDNLTATLDPARCAEWEADVKAWESDPMSHDDPYIATSQGA